MPNYYKIKTLGFSFNFKFNVNSTAKAASTEIWSPKLIYQLILYFEYCCLIWNSSPNCCLNIV